MICGQIAWGIAAEYSRTSMKCVVCMDMENLVGGAKYDPADSVKSS